MSQLRIRVLSMLGIALLGLALVAGCSSSSNTGGPMKVVVAENFWGSIVAQVGGSHIAVTSLIRNPNADPHDYEPSAADSRAVANAQYVVFNGAGYDAWIEKLLSANPKTGRTELSVGDLLKKKEGDNPHFWYSPEFVLKVAQQTRDDLKALDPAHAADYDASEKQFETSGLQKYNDLIAEIKSKYGGTKVGATESIFSYLAPTLGLNVITPDSYLNAVSEGEDIAATDEATVEQQINDKQIAILVYNSQNTPPNIAAILKMAKENGIPQPAVTETLTPANASFQDWQSKQLQGIVDALKQATGK